MRLKILLAILMLGTGVLLGYLLKYPFFGSSPAVVPATNENSGSEEQITKLGFAAVIENAPEARPQAGLALADLVFETLAEGGITRYLAVYESQEASTVGPVRSARPYFVDWARGLGVPLIHSGGSQEALEKIEALGPAFRDVNEFYHEKTFWRDAKKIPPHNLFTSSQLLQKLFVASGWNQETAAVKYGWTFDGEGLLAKTQNAATEIAINFSYDLFAVKYEYDEAGSVYQRFLAGKPHLDSLTSKQIAAKNLVVIYTTSTIIDPKLLTVDLVTLGSGRAVMFRDGKVLQARWKKETAAGALQLLDADGSWVALSPGGPTWIEVIDQTGSAEWK